MKSGVFIAMPVYRGSEVIEETLRSILAQTFQDFHLVMSVDGSDDPTIEICRKYADDPRIDVVVQEDRLGWPGNFNSLVRNCDREFFCYWQQDDLASTGYLENLRREMLARPEAAIAYTDVQWFGGRFDRNGAPGIEGDALSRVMQHIEAIRYEPLRGLMRASMLPRGDDAIPITEDESCQEEFAFLTHMAAAGSFLRVDTAMYFKRLHTSNAFVRWANFPDWRRRRGWISMGTGMYGVARSLTAPKLRSRVLSQILDRLAVDRPGRGFFYSVPQTPAELRRFCRDFVAYGDIGSDLLGVEPETSPALERPIHPTILASLQDERSAAVLRVEVAEQLTQSGALGLDAASQEGEALLGYGWSVPEHWGVWSEGAAATLRIPAPPGSSWRARVEGRVHAPHESVQIGAGSGFSTMKYAEIEPGDSVALTVDSERGDDRSLRLHLPNARAPIEDGLSDDSRKLGFGLTRLEFELT